MTFQSNAFQNNAFQVGGGAAAAADDPILGISPPEIDWTDFSDYGTSIAPLADDAGCQYPFVLSVTKTIDNTSGLSHTVTLPAFDPGDRLILLWGDNFNNSRSVTTGGWTEVLDVTTSSIFVAFRDMDGSEGATITVTNTPDTTEVVHFIVRLRAGTFDGGYAPQATHTLDGADPANPPSLSPSWGTEKAMWIAFCATDSTASPASMTSAPAGYRDYSDFGETGGTAAPDCMAGYGIGFYNSGTQDPGAFAITAQSSWDSATIAVKGLCDPVVGSFVDQQDFTDFTDYGFAVAPLSEDGAVAPEDFILGISEREIDWTDFADYGLSVDPLADDLREDFVLGVSEREHDWTDFGDYGFGQAAGFEQDHHLGTGDGLDFQDWTDFGDYGYSVDPLADDLREDFVLGISEREYDWTDFTDYGFDQAAGFEQDHLLGTDDGQDFQDWTDFTDYGFTLDPLSEEAREDFVLGISEREIDWTDFEDYGGQSSVVVEDVAPPEPPTPEPESPHVGGGQGSGDPGFGQRTIKLQVPIDDWKRKYRLALLKKRRKERENERRKRLLIALIHAMGVLDE